MAQEEPLWTRPDDPTNTNHFMYFNGTTLEWKALATSDIASFDTVVDERARDAVGSALTAGTGITVTPDDVNDTITLDVTVTQYTDEMARDAVGAAITAGTGINVVVDDTANTITISSAITQYTDEMARDALGTAIIAGTGITVTPNDGADTITIATTITQYTDEMARDALGTALTAGAGITITPNDAGDTIEIASSITQYTDELAQDAVGNIITAGAGITVNYTDATPEINIASSITQYTDEMARDAIGAALVAGTDIDIVVDDTANTITINSTAGGGGASDLNGLSDVTISSPATGHILRHDGTDFKNVLGTTHFEVAGAVATHEVGTTNVHGITDTSTLYRAGGTDVAVADGGTGASTAATARTNLSAQQDLNGLSLTDVGTPAAGDRVLLQDASDSNNLKYGLFSTFGGGGSVDDTVLWMASQFWS